MRSLFVTLLVAALVGCSSGTFSSSVSETSTTDADGTKTTRIETTTRNGVTTSRKTETVVRGGTTTKTVYERRGDEWVKVE
jgi:hypothetical protein